MSSRSLLLILLSASVTVSGNLLVRMGVLRAGGFSPQTLTAIFESLLRLIKQPTFDLGMILYVVASLLWFRIISGEQLSVAYPVLVSLTFLMVTIGASVLFKESITLLKVAGMTTIVLGILMVSFS